MHEKVTPPLTGRLTCVFYCSQLDYLSPCSICIWKALNFKWIQKEHCWNQNAYSPRKLEIFASALSHMFFRSLHLQLHKVLILPLGCYDWDCCLSGLETILGLIFFTLIEVIMKIFTLIMRAWTQSLQTAFAQVVTFFEHRQHWGVPQNSYWSRTMWSHS